MVGSGIVRSSVAAALLFAGCNGVWGLDEVTVGEGTSSSTGAASTTTTGAGTGSTTSSAASSSSAEGGGTGTSATGSGGEGGGGGADCAKCGCPSDLPGGEIQSSTDVQRLAFQCSGDYVVNDEGCGTFAWDPTDGQSCAGGVAPLAPIDAGGKCLFGRLRAGGSGGSKLLVELQHETEGDVDLALISKDFEGPDLALDTFECRIPADFVLRKFYFNAQRAEDAPFSIDFIEIDIVDCDDALSECSSESS